MSSEYSLNILFKIFDEVYEVSKYYNTGLTIDDINYLKDMCIKFNSKRVTSLTLDFYNNDKNEMNNFELKFIDLANKANIYVPYNNMLFNLLKIQYEKEKNHH